MTKDELLAELRALQAKQPEGYVREIHGHQFVDRERVHMAADAALLKFINDPDISDAFDAIEKWYA